MMTLRHTVVTVLLLCSCDNQEALQTERVARERELDEAQTKVKQPPKPPEPSVVANAFELGRETQKIEGNLHAYEDLVYVLHCIETHTGKKVDADRETRLLRRRRPSKAMRACKEALRRLTREQIHVAVFDDASGEWLPWPSDVDVSQP